MIKETINGMNGYDIPCIHEINGHEKTVCVVSHGFASCKDSPTATLLLESLPKRGVGVLTFDFPAHGDSPASGDMLRIENCLNDLSCAERRAAELAPDAEIVYFSSSFGAYINLIYISARPHIGKKSLLRSAAVDMPGLFAHPSEAEREGFRRDGFIMLDLNFPRPIKITTDFINDLNAHSVFDLYVPGSAVLRMIHGDKDELASPSDARRFAEMSGAELFFIPNGDHRLMIPGAPEKMLALTEEFFG